jgi:hypothetical protein
VCVFTRLLLEELQVWSGDDAVQTGCGMMRDAGRWAAFFLFLKTRIESGVWIR